ncbi:hypothetical protein DFH07DRAFT_934224 [Mycena maculata]|uniref:Uncharacterized protein n=1 Tax=Mycena maculata TaxID=230809 RepID=A0AAD7HAV3_9AGAR|nr:hypothetical protein DFH07DRAFT_934224 [Mycena maculata]
MELENHNVLDLPVLVFVQERRDSTMTGRTLCSMIVRLRSALLSPLDSMGAFVLASLLLPTAVSPRTCFQDLAKFDATVDVFVMLAHGLSLVHVVEPFPSC